jgi:hypothetical protein
MSREKSLGEGPVVETRWSQAIVLRIVLSNLPFIAALLLNGLLPSFIEVLVVGAIVLIVPGFAWIDHRKGDAAIVLFRAAVASLVAGLAVTLILMLIGAPAHRTAFLICLALITNVGILVGHRKGWFDAAPFADPLPRLISVIAAVFLVQSFLGAAYFVPALEDQDMETQGTAYGLMHQLAPSMVTNRQTSYFFAHPLLLHIWIGESALISDDLGRLKYHDDASLVVRNDPSPSTIETQWNQAYAQFEKDPVLLPTRTPNIFLGALTLFPMGFLVFLMTGSRAAALGACIVYMTLPEIYVRTSYGGYLAITNFFLLSGAYFYLLASQLLPQRGAIGAHASIGRSTWAAAFLGGWTDQKFLLLPMAAPVHAGIKALLDLPALVSGGLQRFLRVLLARPYVIAGLLIGTGFVAGWMTFAAYGLLVAPEDFIQDHLKSHIWWRLNKVADVNLTRMEQGGFVYPSVLALWQQFADHTGWLLVPPMILGLLYAVPRVREAHGLLLIWAVVGMVGFSLVDWRQTKHLAHILPPLVMLTAVYWASLEDRARAMLGAVLVAAIAWNIWRIVQQMNDFEYLQPLPIW